MRDQLTTPYSILTFICVLGKKKSCFSHQIHAYTQVISSTPIAPFFVSVRAQATDPIWCFFAEARLHVDKEASTNQEARKENGGLQLAGWLIAFPRWVVRWEKRPLYILSKWDRQRRCCAGYIYMESYIGGGRVVAQCAHTNCCRLPILCSKVFNILSFCLLYIVEFYTLQQSPL